ncbi:MAG TPA: hypothetical protein DD400_04050 [Rhodospirillaceae bacterium]|nr:hypothetical protein [Rhodospirillaceae bacterium]
MFGFINDQNHPPRLSYLEERSALSKKYREEEAKLNGQGHNGTAAGFLTALALPFTDIKCEKKDSFSCGDNGEVFEDWHITGNLHNLDTEKHQTSFVEIWEIPAEALSAHPSPEDLALSARVVNVNVSSQPSSPFGGIDIRTDPSKVWLVPARIGGTTMNGESFLHDYVAPSVERLKTEKRPKNGVIKLQMPRPAPQ